MVAALYLRQIVAPNGLHNRSSPDSKEFRKLNRSLTDDGQGIRLSDLSKLGFMQKGRFDRRLTHPASNTNGSTPLPFVIPSEAQGSAVRSTDHRSTGKASTYPL